MYSSEHTLCFVDKNKNFNLTVKGNQVTTPFNNMRTLKFKAQPTNAFFATVNQMLASTVERAVIKSLNTFR